MDTLVSRLHSLLEQLRYLREETQFIVGQMIFLRKKERTKESERNKTFEIFKEEIKKNNRWHFISCFVKVIFIPVPGN